MKLGLSDSVNLLLVDTGADVSILKPGKIFANQIVDTNNKCTITGINKISVDTLGSITTSIRLNEETELMHKFQIVHQEFPITADGILGRDFLVKYNCKIDYDTWILYVNFNAETFEIPIEDNVNGEFVLPPRCEVFRQIHVAADGDFVMPSHEVKSGVFCANSIINGKSQLIKLINTNDEVVKISRDFQNSLLPLENFHIFSLGQTDMTNRSEKLKKQLNLDNTPDECKSRLLNLCNKYNNIFALESDSLTCNNFYEQKINLSDPSPVYIKNYRTPESQRIEIDRQIEKMMSDEIIEPSVSPYNSPILLVPKKSTTGDQKWRLVVDFRQLNKKIIADKFPLPRIDDILDQLGRARYFSTLDLMSGFHQIPLEENSKKFTAFSTSSGHYQFTRLPFGLNISPNSFQRMMAIALSGLPLECAFLYIDDIIVVGCSIEHHFKNLEKVFEKLKFYNLKLNPAKCNFFCADVTFLGHHISAEGIQPDKSKYSVIENYPTPNNADEVRRFVAFCNYYRRFIPYFSEIAAPLNNLLKKDTKFGWTQQCQEAFESLKRQLLSPRILKFPDFKKPFILCTDASKVACGAVLSQLHGDIELPIAYASRTFTRSEQKKATIEQELLAIYWAIQYFRPYLYGRRFVVKTDHRPLVYLFSMKDPASKLVRIRWDLEEYSFDIIHVSGKENVGPDALSRIEINSEQLKNLSVLPVQTRSMTKQKLTGNDIQQKSNATETDHLRAYNSVNNLDAFYLPKLTIEFEDSSIIIKIKEKNLKNDFARAQFHYNRIDTDLKVYLQEIDNMAKNLNLKKIAISNMSALFSNVNVQNFKEICNMILKHVIIVIYKPATIINDNNVIQSIIKENHDTPTGGHVGVTRLFKKLRSQYYWTNMLNTIKDYVRNCLKCNQNKHYRHTKEPFIKTNTPMKCFDAISIDTIGPFTKSQSGNRYALTAQCELSKFIIITAIPDKQAKTLAKAFVENCILVHGCPRQIKSDMGSEYKNEVFEQINELLKIDHKFSTAYHHETLGSLERNHRCLNEFLRGIVNSQYDDWDQWLPFYTFCYNTTPHSSHQYTPFELVYGKQPNYPSTLQNTVSIEPVYNIENYASELKFKIQTAAIKARELLELAKSKRISIQSEESYPIEVKVTDKVWLKNENNRKLDPTYIGPFEVVDINHPNLKIRNRDGKLQTVHKNRVRKHDGM